MSDEMGPPEETLDDAIEHVFYPQDDLESKADNSPDHQPDGHHDDQ